MERDEWDALVLQFLHYRKFAPGTREAFVLALRNFAEWCERTGVSPESATQADLLAFREYLRGRKLAINTVNTRFKNVRAFYTFLRRTGRIASNPTDDIVPWKVTLANRNVPTLDELSRLWDVTEGRERIIVGLLGFCGMRRAELRTARAEDLHERAGVRVLDMPSRSERSKHLGYVALPEILAAEIETYLDGRRTGLLLQARGGGTEGVALSYINQVLRRAGRRAELDFRLTSIGLMHALRWLSIEYGFSYLSVVRTVDHGSDLIRTEILRTLDLPPSEHASVRLGRIFSARWSDDELMLLRAENLLADGSQHPAAAVVTASATLERALRETTNLHGIAVTKRDPSINTYATLLRSRELISIADLRTFDRILTFRNDAAHGHFEKVTRTDAEWVLGEARTLIKVLRDRSPRES